MMEDGAKKQAGRRGFGYFFLSFFLGIPLLLGGSLLFWIFFFVVFGCIAWNSIAWHSIALVGKVVFALAGEKSESRVLMGREGVRGR